MNRLLNFFAIVPLTFLVLATSSVTAQNEEDDLYELTLEELMDVSIVSASKKQESLFEAPLASSSISKEEIEKSGATSIPEALRLSPDLIVREVTNGIYDVHVRGFDNVPRYTSGAFQTNQLTLVMIDDRPVFNHNMGVVYWEALPIDIVDVERIEIVKGPAAPLFGSNAVTGVINIITKEFKKEDLNVNGSYQAGTFNTHVGGLSVGYNNPGKFTIGVSGNLQMRDRYESKYYEFLGETYKERDELVNSTGMTLPDNLMTDTEQALDKKGVNFFSSFTISDEINVGLDAGWQDAFSQKYYFDNGYTPFSYFTSENGYLNFDSEIYGLKTRVSFNSGDDNMNDFGTQLSYKYKYDVTEIFMDYNWNVSEKLSIQPSLNYFNANYEPYGDDGQLKLIQGKNSLNTTAASIRFDYKPIENLRLIAGIRGDKFSLPDDFYLAYQFASTYKLNESNLIRASYSKSNSSAFIGPTFLDVEFVFPIGNTNQTGIYEYKGKRDMSLFSMQALELGYRSKIGNNFEASLDLYYQKGENFYGVVTHEVPDQYFQLVSSVLLIENLPIVAHQYGATLSANWVLNTNFQVKPFVTYQHTQSENMPTALKSADNDPVSNVDNTEDVEHETTPNIYGGLYINYNKSRFNLNVNTYFTSDYVIYHQDMYFAGRSTGERDGILNVNARASYKLLDQLSVFVNGKNLLGTDHAQMYGTDRIGTLVLGGIGFKF